MARTDPPAMTATVVVEQQVSFTLAALCHASGAQREQIQALVAEGLLKPTGQGQEMWRFSGEALPRTRKALRLSRDLELDLSAVVLVVDLLAEIEYLRSRLRDD
jgi:chaperone modulatory protein CbpM